MRSGHVDAENAARRRGTRGLASRQPGSAADVEHLVAGADPVGGAKMLVVSAQLGVVEVEAVRRGHRRDAMAQGSAPAITWGRARFGSRRARTG